MLKAWNCDELFWKSFWLLIILPPVEHKHIGLKVHGLKWYRCSEGTSISFPNAPTCAVETISIMKAQDSNHVTTDFWLLFGSLLLHIFLILTRPTARHRRKGSCRFWKKRQEIYDSFWDYVKVNIFHKNGLQKLPMNYVLIAWNVRCSFVY